VQLNFLTRNVFGAKVYIKINLDRERVIEAFGSFCRNDRLALRISARHIFSICSWWKGNAIPANNQSLLMMVMV
jgi:hypothetical protein